MLLINIFYNIYLRYFEKKYNKLLLIGENSNWSIDWDIKELKKITEKLGISSKISSTIFLKNQCLFFGSKYFLINIKKYLKNNLRIAFPYFHGYPSSGEDNANECYKNFKEHHNYIDRVQVTNNHMLELLLDTGIDKKKVFKIPIGINLDFFQKQTEISKKKYRSKYNIPTDAVVIGSFQKDGNGWGEGLEPKLIKGPDIFIESIKILKEKVPGLFILLSGPARGYIKTGLEQIGVPYNHIYLDYYPDLNELYQCLDLYIVSSREEGGPKAVLESMACGIPLVTTKVGQAVEIVKHEENGFLVDVGDVEGIAYFCQKILEDSIIKKSIIEKGIDTAKENCYNSQLSLWESFFDGFVEY